MPAARPIDISIPAYNFMLGSPQCLQHHHLCRSKSITDQSWNCKRCWCSSTEERWVCPRCEDFSICYSCAPVENNTLLDSSQYLLSLLLLRLFTVVPATATMLAVMIFFATLDAPDSGLFQNTSSFLMWMAFLFLPIGIAVSFLRPACGHLSIVSYISNKSYFADVCRKRNLKLTRTGSAGFVQEQILLVLAASANITVVFALKSISDESNERHFHLLESSIGFDYLGFLNLLSIPFFSWDLAFGQLRFCQGSCSLKEAWKKAPLIQINSHVQVYQEFLSFWKVLLLLSL